MSSAATGSWHRRRCGQYGGDAGKQSVWFMRCAVHWCVVVRTGSRSGPDACSGLCFLGLARVGVVARSTISKIVQIDKNQTL